MEPIVSAPGQSSLVSVMLMGIASPRQGVTSRLPAAERKRQLTDVAIETFAEKGYDAASMDDIAEAAGVTKPVLYQHFRSKRALYLELLDYVGGQFLDAIALATSNASGPRQQVEGGFAAYFGFVFMHESSFRLLFASGAQRDDEFDREVRRVEDSIAEAVASLIDADLRPAHKRILGHAVVGLAEGTSRHWITARSEARSGNSPSFPLASSAPSGGSAVGAGTGGRDDSGPCVAAGELAWMNDPDWLARRIAELVWAGLRAVHPE